MKLELKHLADYLPYRLKLLDEKAEINDNIFTLESITIHETVSDNDGNCDILFTEIKPILRPLSDLTKEIEVNGEKFVLLSSLEETFRPSTRDLSIFLFNGKICIDIETENYSQTIDLFDGFLIIQKLLEWHFDIYGLIENGLAIDINTI
jgi:hypothetical protein